MAHKLMSESELHNAVNCYMTLPDPENPYAGKEKVFYRLVSRRVKHFPMAHGGVSVMVNIAPESNPHDAGWYPMNALVFVMPDGTTRK